MYKLITSHHNPKVKSLLSLEKPRERKKQCLFIIEGKKEIELAIAGGYKLGNIFFCEELIHADEAMALAGDERLLIPITRDVFNRIAVRENSGGVVAIAEQKTHRLEQLTLSKQPLILVLEAVEKPGNLGAILRTADAAGVDAVIICDPQTDFYNPNVVRSSVGTIFTNQVASCTSGEAIAWLQANKIDIITTSLEASKSYHTIDYTRPCAIVMGTEATGISSEWIEQSIASIIIPMSGKVDSMNVSTSTAVVVFEAKRQRGF